MLTDAQVQSALTTKKFGILDADWQVVPDGEDEPSQQAAELVRFALGQLRGSVTRILLNALDALAHGYSVQEINYSLCEQDPWRGRVIWQSIKSKPPRLFRLEIDEYRNLKSLYLRMPGGQEQPLPAEKFVLYAYNSRYESPYGRSDLRSAYKHWWAKQLLLKFWLLSLEKFGAPVRAIFPGRCFRYEAIDPSHENTFYQCEGLLVDKDISVANLIAVMKALLGEIFHRDVAVRLRPGAMPVGCTHRCRAPALSPAGGSGYPFPSRPI
uniref:DUF935 family protein n=1 Tax=Anaerolinea thermolimosa TaxID=229919 RepID=A0A7C4PLY3_9CHLR